VVHRDDSVVDAGLVTRKEPVGGKGTIERHPLLPKSGDNGDDDALLLRAEVPVLAGMRI
jgi:hypothetical protein